MMFRLSVMSNKLYALELVDGLDARARHDITALVEENDPVTIVDSLEYLPEYLEEYEIVIVKDDDE